MAPALLQVPAPHILTSPYRAPLVRFLARYPADTAAYFLSPVRLDTPAYFALLRDVVRGGPARVAMALQSPGC